jgi:hypothetical protein
MYCDPSKAVTGKRQVRSEKRASARNLDDGVDGGEELN